MRVPVLLSLTVVTAVLAGCASSPDEVTDPVDEPITATTTDVRQRAQMAFNLTDDFMSHTLEDGLYGILEPLSVYVDIALPATEGGAAVDPVSPPVVHLGVILPDIPGCDFDSVSVEGGQIRLQHTGHEHTDCQVPVVADAGPYWGESDVEADARGSGRLGETLIQNLVPHGYAVAQISVFGSGKSNHCFDMFGLSEQLGVAGAVEWLGAQEWSNGNVGLIGRSYDGSTPWMAAAHGPEALKTIVPISGLSGLGDLVTWNGASETRVALFQNFIYAQFGLGGEDLARDVQHRLTCPDWPTSTAWGVEGYIVGGELVEGDYWEERNFREEVLQNYQGSVYMIHGLLDNNVDPHAGWIAHQQMIEKGLETKGLYGQWYHSYPDRWTEHGTSGPSNSVRFDWAQDLLEWFDHYLKDPEMYSKPDLHVEVQQFDGRWRLDDSLQPSNAEILEVPVTQTGRLDPVGSLTWSLGVLDEDDEVLLAGLSELQLEVTGGPASQIYVELIDATEGSSWGLSYGIARLDRAPGQPETPGDGLYTIPLQYFAGALPAGHELGIRLASFGNNYLPSPGQTSLLIGGGDSKLLLSTMPVDQAEFFDVPTRAE